MKMLPGCLGFSAPIGSQGACGERVAPERVPFHKTAFSIRRCDPAITSPEITHRPAPAGDLPTVLTTTSHLAPLKNGFSKVISTALFSLAFSSLQISTCANSVYKTKCL